MGDRSLRAVISARSDVEIAAIFERIWEARGYDTEVRFSGPDVHVDAEGETDDGTRRAVRIWVTTGGRVRPNQTSAYVRECERAGVEPYIAVVGNAELDRDAHRPELVEFSATSIAVQAREAGVEGFVHAFADDGDGDGDSDSDSDGDSDGDEAVEWNWLGDRVGDEDAEADDADGDDTEDADDDTDAVSRRAAMKTAGKYVAGSLVAYLAVEAASDTVRRSPELRRAIARRTRWVGAHLPTLPGSNPAADAGGSATQNASGTGSALANASESLPTNASGVVVPPDATTIDYERLRSDPQEFVGTTVAYVGAVTNTTTRTDRRFVLLRVVVDGRLRGDVVGWWPDGRFFDGDLEFRLLQDERVLAWGRIDGTSSLFFQSSLPRLEIRGLQRL
ncbi:MAG: hypothetical protein ABEK02_05610 [Haloquadratum sp.]